MSLNKFSRDNIVLNNTIINNISNIINNDKLTNSYILEGLDGSGKNLIAKYFAKSLLCDNFITEPCNQCDNCLNFEKNNITDVNYISSKKSSLSIEEVRHYILDTVFIKPQSQKYKIYIIEANEITIQAQNSLLKTIEEPPSYAIFIFMTSKISMFLPTILSRCTLFKTQYIDSDLVYNYLSSLGLPYSIDELKMVSNLETGSIGQALTLLESTGYSQNRLDILKLLTNLNKADLLSCVNYAKDCEKYKNDMNNFYKIMIALYRDLFIYKSTGNKNLINQKDIEKELIIASENFKLSKLEDNFNYINKAISTQHMNNSFTLGLETLFLKLSNLF